jgi:hypothetical protein
MLKLQVCMPQRLSIYCFFSDNTNSSLGIATGYTAGVRLPVGERDVSLLHSVQTGSGVHPASYPMGIGGALP